LVVFWYISKQNEQQRQIQIETAKRDSIYLIRTQKTLDVQETMNHKLQLQIDSLTKRLYQEMGQKKSSK